MNKLLVTIAAAALVGIPLAAHAQYGADYRTGRQGHVVRPATAHGRDADARLRDRRTGAARYGALGRPGFDTRRFDPRLGARGLYRSDRLGGRGDVVLGFGGYPYGGYYAGASPCDGYGGYYDDGFYPSDSYGADFAYSYPDEYGTYQPFDYGYAPGDDAYAAEGAPEAAEGPYDAPGAPYVAGEDRYQPAPDEGWSAGGPPADCGQWVWREGRGAYEWVPAACSYPGEPGE